MKKCAIILAAGFGSRLAPITNYMPKSLVRVAGRPILDYQIDGYKAIGISEENITIVTGYMSDKITDWLRENYPSVRIVESIDYRTTNNMYSLYLALKDLEKMNDFDLETCFINNADCLYDRQLMIDFSKSDVKNAIATQKGVYIEESMKVVEGEDSSLINIGKKIPPKDSVGVSVDLYKFSKEAITKLYKIIKDFIEIKKDLKQWTEVAFPYLFAEENVYPVDIKNKKWVEVDNNDDLLVADKLFSNFDLNKKKAIICDMDGTLYVGNNPISEAINFIKTHSDSIDFYYLTNNTSKTPTMYVDKLKKMGISTTIDKIATPLYALINKINNENWKSIYLVANKSVECFLKEKLPNVKFDYNLKENQAVCLTYDTEITYEKLKNMAIILNQKDIPFIATHTDVFCPHECGPIPDIGSILELIKKTNGKEPDYVLGKPSVELIKYHLEKYGCDKIAIVGDRLYTDKKLADNANCDFICVLSGETTRLDVAKYEGRYPSIVVSNLGNVF